MFLPKSINPEALTVPHLVTIPYSHYCEVARWGLDLGGIAFQEVKYAPGYHAKAVGQLRKRREDRSESSYVGQESGVHGGRRKYSVPLLCLPEGRIIRDSWEILEYALGAPDPDWRRIADQELGITVRQIAYHYLLMPESKHLLNNMIDGSSLYERTLWFFVRDKLMDGMKQLMAITPENVESGKDRVVRILEKASEALEKYDGSLQEKRGFGATEVAFCSLAAINLFPEEFSNGAATLPVLADFPLEFREHVERCRSTRAGQFVLDSYVNRRALMGKAT